MTGKAFQPLGMAILTISDSRTAADDKSGKYLCEAVEAAGHKIHHHAILPDEKDELVAKLRSLVADESIEVIISTGGTGLTGRDITPEAVRAVAEKEIDGFSWAFHRVSYEGIGLSTCLSRALGAVAGGTYIFALPGSPGACRDGWEKILCPLLDIRTRPCNFAEMLPRLGER